MFSTKKICEPGESCLPFHHSSSSRSGANSRHWSRRWRTTTRWAATARGSPIAWSSVFDKLVQVLVLGAAYEKISDAGCSATTIRRRCDEWIDAGIFTALEQICLEAYDRIVGLELENLTVDGCIVKAPCGGEVAGKSPVDRGKLGTKRSVLTDGEGIPLGCVAAPANPLRQTR